MPRSARPYNVYMHSRPARLAFVLSCGCSSADVDRFMEYSCGLWGGRWNPIVIAQGDSVTETDWRFLKQIDPDYILVDDSLSEALREDLRMRLCPLDILQIDLERQVATALHLVPCGPSVCQVPQRGIAYARRCKLACFCTSDGFSQFFRRNFGPLGPSQSLRDSHPSIHSGWDFLDYGIHSESDLAHALEELANMPTLPVFRSQLAARSPTHIEPKWSELQHRLQLVVGDSPQDLACHWNRLFHLRGSWQREQLCSVWLPLQLLESAAIRDPLLAFLARAAEGLAASSYRGTELVSYSLSSDRLERLRDSLQDRLLNRDLPKIMTAPSFPECREVDPFPDLARMSQLHRASHQEEVLSIEEPQIACGTLSNYEYMLDTYIEYRPERFPSLTGKTYWWQVPRRQDLPKELTLFARRRWRVNRFHSFSVSMRMSTATQPDDARINLKIPHDSDLFHSLLSGQVSTEDPRTKTCVFLKDLSDEGEKLLGVLGLFPDLCSAGHFFQTRYWRRMLERMARVDKEGRTREQVENRLRKELHRGRDPLSESNVDRCVELILEIARQHWRIPIDLEYRDLEDEARVEVEEWNATNPQNQLNFDEDGFRRAIDDCLQQRILFMGISPRCDRCGVRQWLPLGDASQELKCKGCGFEFCVSPEEIWKYRSNSLLLAAATRHGIIPTVLVLSQLQSQSRSSFLYLPCCDLTHDGKKAWREIDIACIQDGEFVIGEVKENCAAFKKSDFGNMREVATALMPDRLIFSSMNSSPSEFVRGQLAKLREDLSSFGICVEWLQINPGVLEARPVF